MHRLRALVPAVALIAFAARSLVCPAALAQPKPAAPAKPAASAKPAAAAKPAEKDDPYGEEDEQLALEQYKKGADLALKKKWSDAYPLFLDAWKHFKHWQIALGLGGVELELGKYRAAAEHLGYARGAADIQEPYRSEAVKRLAQAQEKLGAVRVTATAPGSAQVWLDGELLGSTPFSGSTPADPGQHRIEVRLGEKREGRDITVAQGATVEVKLDLQVPEAEPPPRPPESAFPKVPVVAGLAGLSAAGVGLGVALSVAAAGAGSDATQKLADLPALAPGKCSTTPCVAVHRALAAQASFETGAIVAFSVAGLAALGALSVVFLPSILQPKKPAAVVPILGPGVAGLSAQGSF